MRSINDAIKFVMSLKTSTYTSNQDGQSTVDTKGYNDAELVLSIGDIDSGDGDETYTVKVLESSDDGSSDAYSVAKDADGNDLSWSISTSSTSSVVNKQIGSLDKHERYLRVDVETGGTTPSIDIAGVIALGRAYQEPV